MTLLDKIRRTILKYGMIQPGDKILLAFSGGIDSSALLHLLMALRQEWAFELYLAHFNHKLRVAADKDESFVRERAAELQLPLFVGWRDVREEARRRKTNLEEEARFWRYKFLTEKAQEIGGAKIALGHNLNDQVETFFLRLFRGAGLSGIGGMKPCLGQRIIRPLIEISRQEIELYLQKNQIPYRVDRSNFDRRFLRNKIRAELIPYLEREFDTALLDHISIFMTIVREEEEVLAELARKEAEKMIREEEGVLQLDRAALLALRPALGRRVIREYLRQLKGDLRSFSFRDVEAVRTAKPGRIITLSRDLRLRCESNIIYYLPAEAPQEFYYRWNGQGRLELSEIGFIFEGRVQKKWSANSLSFNDWRGAFFDRQKLSLPLIIKPRQPSDRYQPLGGSGRKKLKELFRERKIPLFLRPKWPVFWSGQEIIWAPGLPVAEKVKIDHQTKEIFQIRVVKGSFLSKSERPEDSIIDG